MAENETLVRISKDGETWKKRKELQKDLYTALSNIVLQEGKTALPTGDKLKKLQELLEKPEFKTLDTLVKETKNWDAASTIPHEKSFLYYTRQQEVFGKLLAETDISFPYIQLMVKRFNAYNERIEPKLDAPIHYAVRQLNGKFLDWLLAQQSLEESDTRPEETPCADNERTEESESEEENNDRKRKRYVDVNLRNSKKETALAILCASYDECMKVINKPIEEIKKDEKEKHVDKQQKCKKMLPEIQVLIKKLIAAGADFNICSLQLKLPFELLLKYRSADEATPRFVDQCVQQADQALVIGRINDSKMRVVEIYKSPMQSPEESPKESPVKVREELLEICLHYNDQQSFVNYLTGFKITKHNVKKVIEVVLHTAVEQKMSECVRKIVDLGGALIFEEIRQTKQNTEVTLSVHRLELKGLLKKACLVAELSIVKILIAKMKDLQLLNDDPLLALTLTNAYAIKRRSENREALLAVAGYLASQTNIYMTRTDNSGNTPLHLALRYGFHEIANTLLKQRYAYVGLRNRDNMTPLDYGGYEFWKNYLDSCIEVDSERATQDRNVIRFNLNCLEPYNRRKKFAASFKNSKTTAAQSKDSCCFIFQYASKVKQQPHNYGNVQTELTIIRQIAESNDLKRLLIHPIIYTFIMVKWIRLSPWMYLNFLLTFTTMLVFGLHSLDACSVDTSPSQPLWIGALLGTLYIVIREILQLVILRTAYATFENVMDLANIVGMIFVLLKGCHGVLSSFLMINFALQLTFLLGSLPFNSLSTIMYMFKTVSLNFLKSFLIFLPLIGSFIFAFHLTYNESSVEVDGSVLGNNNDTSRVNNCSTTTGSFNNFCTFWNATIKTLVMTIGEFEAADIDFSGEKLFLFLVFLFVAPIVILNLINGLAVSDIAAIRAESELIGISKKVMLLEQYEQSIVTMSWSWLKRWFPAIFFGSYTCRIHVRTDQFRKILVQLRSDKSKSSTGSSTVQAKSLPTQPVKSTWIINKATGICIGQERTKPKEKSKSKWTSLTACYPLWHNGTDTVINLRFNTIPTFLTLDHAITNEALAVIERMHPIVKQPVSEKKQAILSGSKQPLVTRESIANSNGHQTHSRA
ncbi:uncharacterized protein LOC125960160 [Anopheles darlingi]|uniref:uncharacterized protein LOC125960160 n=1 Tax=Anopheles darlingi TaxID=43151 RepID=UPI002100616E|nr:uncharacterized protein LOC125960160 [Anopheles darlingi]